MTKTCARCHRDFIKPSRRGMCPACYMAWHTRRHGYGTFESVYVDAEPARQHVAQLRAAGLGLRRIAEVSGCGRERLRCLTIGRSDRGTGPSRQILASHSERLLAIPLPEAPHIGPSDGARVPALGTVRRMRSLVAAGHSRASLCARIGVQPSNGTRLFCDPHGRTTAATAARCAALFDELQLVPGTCRRAINEGRRKRWPLPLDWDEDSIDDPAATVQHSRRTSGYDPKHDPERIAARQQQVAALTRAGLSANEIAARLGVTQRTVVRDRAIA